MNIEELKDICSYIIDNNKELTEQGKKTSSIEIVGESGLGKTSSVIQLAQEREMDIVKLNLAQIEEIGDLVGYPITEYKLKGINEQVEGEVVIPQEIEKWVPEKLLTEYFAQGYRIADNETRMSYAPPAWLPKQENPNGGILILDDWNRADQRFIQACMELIDRGTYISWELPKNWTICLTSNPDTGDYNVQSVDNAQRTRYISFNLDFDHYVWARWAEKEGIDGRCINFVLMNPEILEKKEGVQTINPRSIVTFFNTISGFSNFKDAKTLANIQLIADGCFSGEKKELGSLFVMFINNNLDKLLQPKDMFDGWDTVKKKLYDCIYPNGSYRADIAAIMALRFTNYIILNYNQGKLTSEKVNNRIIDLVTDKDNLFPEDLVFHLVKTLVSKYPTRTNKLIINPKIASKLL